MLGRTREKNGYLPMVGLGHVCELEGLNSMLKNTWKDDDSAFASLSSTSHLITGFHRFQKRVSNQVHPDCS